MGLNPVFCTVRGRLGWGLSVVVMGATDSEKRTQSCHNILFGRMLSEMARMKGSVRRRMFGLRCFVDGCEGVGEEISRLGG